MGLRIVLLAALIISGIIVVGAAIFNAGSPPTIAAAVDQRPMIVVAATSIPTGALITQANLSFAPLPENAAPDQVFMRPKIDGNSDQGAADRKTFEEVAGAVARRRFEPGEPLQRGAVVKPGDSGFLAAVLEPGMRSVTIAVTATSGTGGLIYPGDRVDIILSQTFTGPDVLRSRRSAAETIAQNIRVLAIDQQLQAKASPTGEGKLAQTVTLEVSPEQVQQVVVAAKLGELSLTIRSLQPGDDRGTGGKLETVWSDEVSPALKEATTEPVKPLVVSTGGPVVTVMHGDKAESVSLH
jgi:pilus assembly protein CpaB